MRPLFSCIALLSAICIVSCAAAPPVPPDANITYSADPGKLPFDPHGARLRAAMAGLSAVAGQTMTLDLDVALLREYRSWFETGLLTAIENTSHDLGELKRTRAEAWAEIAPKLKTLSFRYEAAANKVEVTLEADRQTVAVIVPAKASTFLSHEAALLGLEAQYDQTLPQRYVNGVPPAVSVAEKRAYFRALTGQKPPPKKIDDPANLPGIANEVRLSAISRAIRFYDVAMPLELKAELHEWLLNEGNYFRDAYVVYPDAVKTSPPTSAFHRAEAAWVDWTQRNDDRFTDGERVVLAKMIFVKQPGSDRAGGGRYVAFAFPGFDRVAFGLRVLEEWVSAGHPQVVPGRDRLLELFERMVCPAEQGQRGERVQPATCDHDFYGVVVQSEEAEKRFFDFLLAQKDEVLVETAFVNLMRMRATRAVTAFWRGLDGNEVLWKAATRAIAEEMNDAAAGRLLDEALRLWQTYPARRGALLYLLSQIDRYGNDRVTWGAWGDTAGGRASAADFGAFLGYGQRALATAWVVWPLLGRGWSRAELLVPRLDRFIEDPQVPFYHPQDPELALVQVVHRMCAEKNFADLAKMHAYFVERGKRSAPADDSLADLLQETSRGRCKPNARPIVRVTPLDATPRRLE